MYYDKFNDVISLVGRHGVSRHPGGVAAVMVNVALTGVLAVVISAGLIVGVHHVEDSVTLDLTLGGSDARVGRDDGNHLGVDDLHEGIPSTVGSMVTSWALGNTHGHTGKDDDGDLHGGSSVRDSN